MSSYTQRVKKDKLHMAKVKARKWKSREKQKRRRLSKQIRSRQALHTLFNAFPSLLDLDTDYLISLFRVFRSLPKCGSELQTSIIDQIRRNKSLVTPMISNLSPGETMTVGDWRQIPEITRTQRLADFFKSWTPVRILEFVQLCQQLPTSKVAVFIWGNTEINTDILGPLDIRSIMDQICVEKVMDS